jgi:hypothetical protein
MCNKRLVANLRTSKNICNDIQFFTKRKIVKVAMKRNAIFTPKNTCSAGGIKKERKHNAPLL